MLLNAITLSALASLYAIFANLLRISPLGTTITAGAGTAGKVHLTSSMLLTRDSCSTARHSDHPPARVIDDSATCAVQ